MFKADKSKRTFFKNAATAVGSVAAASYLSKFMILRSNSIHEINDHGANDVIRQKKAWLQKQLVPMTDNDKNQMLDKIIDSHNKYHT